MSFDLNLNVIAEPVCMALLSHVGPQLWVAECARLGRSNTRTAWRTRYFPGAALVPAGCA